MGPKGSACTRQGSRGSCRLNGATHTAAITEQGRPWRIPNELLPAVSARHGHADPDDHAFDGLGPTLANRRPWSGRERTGDAGTCASASCAGRSATRPGADCNWPRPRPLRLLPLLHHAPPAAEQTPRRCCPLRRGAAPVQTADPFWRGNRRRRRKRLSSSRAPPPGLVFETLIDSLQTLSSVVLDKQGHQVRRELMIVYTFDPTRPALSSSPSSTIRIRRT